MEELDYKKLKELGYGEHVILDENDNVVDVACNHYFNSSGECVFCGEIQFNSYLYLKLYGGE